MILRVKGDIAARTESMTFSLSMILVKIGLSVNEISSQVTHSLTIPNIDQPFLEGPQWILPVIVHTAGYIGSIP
jgi:hypothetical protein